MRRVVAYCCRYGGQSRRDLLAMPLLDLLEFHQDVSDLVSEENAAMEQEGTGGGLDF